MTPSLVPGSDKPVLNVNDSAAARYLVTRILQAAGFKVVEAETGQQALDLIAEATPRLIVLDIKLPDIDGLQICRRVKASPETQSIKVLHTSAIFTASEAKVQSLESGADGYLSHPFEQEELIATTRSLLRLSETEKDLRNTAAELREANTRIHEFLAMLAHELRNPLSAITTCIPLLERFEPRDAVEASARGVIGRQTVQLRRLVDDLLDAARVTQGKIKLQKEPVELTALLHRTADSIGRARIAGAKQSLAIDLPDAPITVLGDSLRLEQIFSNLLDNASKYSPSGKEIQLSARVSSDGRQARVLVRDQGVGISPVSLPTIFDLFSQADVPLARSRGGLGIGLTLVRSLVQIHGGQVHARSAGLGEGSEFEVTLPVLLGTQAMAEPDGTLLASDMASQVRRRIAIVEDNPDVQVMLRTLLESWGHEVRVASDGHGGIDMIRELKPDLALIDIGLPSLDGFEVARQVRQHLPEKRPFLVALTGYGSRDQRERALDSGFDLHIPKPAEPAQLAALIRSLS
jgi:two-component system, sensor histidine kinase